MSSESEESGRDGREKTESDLARVLDRMAAEQAAHLDEARRLDDAPGLDRVASILDQAWAEADEGTGPGSPVSNEQRNARTTPKSPAGLSGPRIAIVLAVAAAIVALIVLVPDDPAPGLSPGTVLLGDSDLRILAPAEGSAGWEIIEWTGPTDARFRVDVLNPADDTVLLGPHRTSETTWRPELPTDLSSWPDEVLIRIEVVRPGEPTPERTDVFVHRPR